MIEAVMLWNEPNNKSHWNFETYDPEWRLFASMVAAAGEAISAENPTIPRVLGGMSPIDPSFLARLDGHDVLQHVDAVAVHGFPLDWNHWPIQQWPEQLRSIQDAVNLPVWVSEVGASSFGAEEVQDFGLARTAELLTGRAPRIHWYSLYDLPSTWEATTRHREAEGSSYYRHFYMGLLREDGSPKLAARRFHEYTPELGVCQWFGFEDHRLEEAVRWLRRLGVTYVRTGLSWADWFRPGAPQWFDRQMAALDEFDVTVTFCFTPEHLGLEPHHTSPPRSVEGFAEFCAEMVSRYAPLTVAPVRSLALLDDVRAEHERSQAVIRRRDTSSGTAAGQLPVLTFHRCINYGSYWQARCLVDGLREQGLDPVILDHDSPRANIAEWTTSLRPTLPWQASDKDAPLYREKVSRFSAAISGLPLSQRFDLHDPGELGPFETVLVGSDEVWNLSHPWFGASPLFFGEGLRASRLVSYAATFGSYATDDGLPPQWAALLGKFDSISVRDDHSRSLIARATHHDPLVVLDPCLQFPPQPTGTWTGPEQPFVAVYGHTFTPGFQQQVMRWAAARHLLVVSIGYRNEWADLQWVAAGPDDFVQCIARSAAVATNFFHGCVFALAFGRPFACETSPYRHAKITSLLMLLRCEQRRLPADAPPGTVDALLETGIEADAVSRMDVLRTTSNSYLRHAV